MQLKNNAYGIKPIILEIKSNKEIKHFQRF